MKLELRTSCNKIIMNTYFSTLAKGPICSSRRVILLIVQSLSTILSYLKLSIRFQLYRILLAKRLKKREKTTRFISIESRERERKTKVSLLITKSGKDLELQVMENYCIQSCSSYMVDWWDYSFGQLWEATMHGWFWNLAGISTWMMKHAGTIQEA